MKAILQYSNFWGDGNRVYTIFAENGVEILNTSDSHVCPMITIRVKDYNELLSLLYLLNKTCTQEVRLVKTKPDKTILDRIKEIFMQ